MAMKGLSNIMAYKYNTNSNSFNGNIVDSLICNKNCHVVSIFKDYMIYDFIDEFLKRYLK